MEGDIMIVTSENGAPVNMRESASTNSRIVTRVPVGAEVTVLKPDTNGWTKVSYSRYQGYMMSRFLREEDVVPPIDPDDDGNDEKPSAETEAASYRITLQLVRDAILKEIESEKELVSKINEVLKRFETT